MLLEPLQNCGNLRAAGLSIPCANPLEETDKQTQCLSWLRILPSKRLRHIGLRIHPDFPEREETCFDSTGSAKICKPVLKERKRCMVLSDLGDKRRGSESPGDCTLSG